jgi:micrococcal nuclease
MLKSVTVIRIIDGDTLVVNYDGKEETVRLIGVDTPETVHPTK